MTWTTQPRSKIGVLATISTGTGPLVVLIHGVGLRSEAWGAQIEALSRSYRVIALDMPGHGASPALAVGPNMADYVETIVAVLDEPAIVIGHSFGAMIALQIAIRHPAKVKAVAALNAIHGRDADAKATVKLRANKLDGRTIADPTATLIRWFGADVSPQRMACEEWLRNANPAGYRDAYRVFATEDGAAEADLNAIQCPVLCLTGKEESNSTPDMSRKISQLTPNGRAEIIDGAAHMLPMTHATCVNALLSDFIESSV